MAITRKLLARGVKLLREHVYDPLDDMATALGAAITYDYLKEPMAPVRMTFCIPLLDGDNYVAAATYPGHQCIPFVLPPTSQFRADGKTFSGTPELVLDEVQLSFDTKRESAAVQGKSFAADGFLAYDQDTAYDLRVSIREKRMRVFDTGAPYVPENEVVALELPKELFLNDYAKQNPYLRTGLEKALDPYKTYVLYIDASGLDRNAGADHYALVSLTVSLRFKCRLQNADLYNVTTNPIQNIPTSHLGAKTPAVVTISSPAAGSDIEADTATGVQANIEVVDDIFLERLKGGYGEHSDMPVASHISHDAAYDIIPVPMWCFGDAITKANLTRCPYFGGVYTVPTCDRRVIPIRYPWTLHHVVVATSYAYRGGPGRAPASANFKTQVGVSIGSLIRSDHVGYQQVAYLEWTPADKTNYMLDAIKAVEGLVMSIEAWDYELLHIPMVYPAATYRETWPLTSPYNRTGRPIHMARGHNVTDARTNIASAVGGAAQTPVTLGQEQFIEVRWLFQDTVLGLNDAGYHNDTVFAGYNGSWVYLIGKKALAGGKL